MTSDAEIKLRQCWNEDFSAERVVSELPPFTRDENNSLVKFEIRGKKYPYVELKNIPEVDLSAVHPDLFEAVRFSDLTICPPASKKILDDLLEQGKDPELGIRNLHRQGITGKDVNIAVIDQPLCPHQEYDGRIKHYEEFGDFSAASMHGPAVTSLAVGKTTGVAPEASVYYFAVSTFIKDNDGRERHTPQFYIQALDRLLEINKSLPETEKIRAVSLSVGYSQDNPEEYKSYINKLTECLEAGIMPCICDQKDVTPELDTRAGKISSVHGKENFELDGSVILGQAFMNPQEKQSSAGTLLIPAGGRTFANAMNDHNYFYSSLGGKSWTSPWLAGLYACCCQQDCSLSPQRFIDVLKNSMREINLQDGTKCFVPQPEVMISKLRELEKNRLYANRLKSVLAKTNKNTPDCQTKNISQKNAYMHKKVDNSRGIG